MAHLLLFEVPGGNDFTVLEDALADGHTVTFVTSDVCAYQGQGANARASLQTLSQIIEINPYSFEALEERVLAAHAIAPFEAIVCILDIRIIDAARLAERLGLLFLSSACARLARDKFSVRERLLERGVRQPRFALAASADELARAVQEVGYPALVKPSDGYGSQNVRVLRTAQDVDDLRRAIEISGRRPVDYGLGVYANNRMSVEQFVAGDLVGCDVFTSRGERAFLGVNDKLMYPPPSFAIRGSCFPSERHDHSALRTYAFDILDAMEFDFGAAHIEMILAGGEPYLVEVNPRLVSAQIPFQMGYAYERSIYIDLINLHLGRSIAWMNEAAPVWFSAIRWIVAERCGRLREVRLPEIADPMVRRVVVFKADGDTVGPPITNSDRIGYVIGIGATQSEAEQTAEAYARASQAVID